MLGAVKNRRPSRTRILSSASTFLSGRPGITSNMSRSGGNWRRRDGPELGPGEPVPGYLVMRPVYLDIVDLVFFRLLQVHRIDVRLGQLIRIEQIFCNQVAPLIDRLLSLYHTSITGSITEI